MPLNVPDVAFSSSLLVRHKEKQNLKEKVDKSVQFISIIFRLLSCGLLLYAQQYYSNVKSLICRSFNSLK